jgi:hypothetical protein
MSQPSRSEGIVEEQKTKSLNITTRKVIESSLPPAERQTFSLDLLCECSNPDCQQEIELPLAARKQLCDGANQFIVASDHVDPRLERVVKVGQGFVVVEKPDLPK